MPFANKPPVSLALALIASQASASETVHMKPAIAGFIDMQTITWHNTDDSQPTFTLDNIKKYPGVFGGIVLNATWNEMQVTPDGPLITRRIDRVLNQVRKFNAAHPDAPLGVKLRIFQGNQAPPWAKAIGGGPLTIQRNPQGCPSGDCPITIGPVWNPKYIAAWRSFQAKVAARYDREPLIRAVAITSCTMETDEPFVMPVDQPIPPGYTDKADKRCLRGAVDDYAGWRRTIIDYTFNAFDQIEMGGTDPRFTLAVMNGCRAALGPRCELGNHAFQATMPEGNAEIVKAISKRGAPIHFQTVGPKVEGFTWRTTIRAAAHDYATGIELWPDAEFGGFTTLSRNQMQKLKALFDAKSRDYQMP